MESLRRPLCTPSGPSPGTQARQARLPSSSSSTSACGGPPPNDGFLVSTPTLADLLVSLGHCTLQNVASGELLTRKESSRACARPWVRRVLKSWKLDNLFTREQGPTSPAPEDRPRSEPYLLLLGGPALRLRLTLNCPLSPIAHPPILPSRST